MIGLLNDEEIKGLREEVKEKLDLLGTISDEELYELIEESVFSFSDKKYLSTSEKINLVERLFNSFRGYDVLQPLIDDRSISEIMINSKDEIFIERNGKVIKAPVVFESQEKLEDIIQAIVAKVNRIVNEASPIVDARLKDGSRVNVVLPPIALKGPTMTIRKFPDKPLTIADLIRFNAITGEAADFLQKLVLGKYNIFISGGTGSGKTTFLNALSNYIPSDERLITIEDSAELQIKNIPNIIQLETRNANTEGKGEISIRDLIRASLRMRPDRIIVGEVRGAEALDMLQAMNTGHDGSLSTGHANSTKDMLSRLETMVLSGSSLLPVEVIRKQICSAIDIMIHLARFRDHTRKVVGISEIIGYQDGEIVLNSLFEFIEEGEIAGVVLGSLVRTENQLHKQFKLKMAGLAI